MKIRVRRGNCNGVKDRSRVETIRVRDGRERLSKLQRQDRFNKKLNMIGNERREVLPMLTWQLQQQTKRAFYHIEADIYEITC